jgi:retinol dehydrogenase 12
MVGKIVLITGATEGIGKATAIQLAGKGYQVVVHGRNVTKAQAVVNEIQQVTGNINVDYLLADLSSLAEVRKLTQAFQDKYDRLDVLINNAAAMFATRQSSQDGHEMMLAVNYLW